MKRALTAPDRLDTPGRETAKYEARLADWRMGHTVYQIYVDRFAPSQRLDGKRHHYASPKLLRDWSQQPSRGNYLADVHNNEGEIEFWGGDFDSVRGKVDYLKQLGVEVVYFNPVFEAFTNHKYDGYDYFRIDPQFGTKEELKELVEELHANGIRVLLDGVFNHLGRRSPHFLEAKADPSSPKRSWFFFGDEYRNGYRAWRNGANLPELNLENPEVRRMAIEGPDSAVQHYIRDIGIDGWRIDVGPDVGYRWLRAVTDNSHEARPDTVVIGECWNYPEEWLHVMDGVMNMHARMLLLKGIGGEMPARALARALDRMAADCDEDGLLRSHLVLDNHDTPRLRHFLKSHVQRALARTLQFTLPGCPVVYYGSEADMDGGHDPGSRGPMDWDAANDTNPHFRLVKQLAELRREHPALRVGSFRVLEAEKLLAFIRTTDRARETILVLANPSREWVRELVPIRDSRLMDASALRCLLSGERVHLQCGTIETTVPPHSARVYRTEDLGDRPGYSMFKRVP
ncbi:MAG: alpha-amylase family glycosyl hydrolase [Candidatus Sumerlaeia bacterium]|nr:alpha-amylase family glycosyl hydrolase [Candidatus Sumerlaeia bacterium]